MVQGLIGKKIGMTQIYTPEGAYVPVTVVEVGPCRVAQKKATLKEGYDAVQLAYGETREKHVNKPVLGHLKKASLPPYRHLREFRGDSGALEVGQTIGVDIFQKGERVDVAGVTKGKGFQGVIKRHKFAGGPASHGSMFHRAPGSIGAHRPGRDGTGETHRACAESCGGSQRRCPWAVPRNEVGGSRCASSVKRCLSG